MRWWTVPLGMVILTAGACDLGEYHPFGEGGVDSDRARFRLLISVETIGEDLDADGYLIRVAEAVTADSSITLRTAPSRIFENWLFDYVEVPATRWTINVLVSLENLAENCAVVPASDPAGDNPVAIQLKAGGWQRHDFRVTCVAL